MRIVNIIEINRGIIQQVLSFPIYEEQLSQDVVDSAERTFKEIVLKNNSEVEEEELELFIEDGHYDNHDGYNLSMVWSDVY